MRSALPGLKGVLRVALNEDTVRTLSGSFEHSYTGVLGRGVQARGRARNDRGNVS